jgi:ATP-dependent DNA ligase
VRADGVTSFSMIQAASDSGNAASLVFFLFDLLYLDGEDLCARPLIERKARLAALLSDARSPPRYCDHQIGHGRVFHEKACAMALEGIVSKRAAPTLHARNSALRPSDAMLRATARHALHDRLPRLIADREGIGQP